MLHTAKGMAYILAVTRALNELDEHPDVEGEQDYYIQVRLVEQGTHEVVGEWSDELGPGWWYYTDKVGD